MTLAHRRRCPPPMRWSTRWFATWWSGAYSLANGGFLVRLRGSEGWLQLAPDAKPAARLAEGWQGRVGDLRSRRHEPSHGRRRGASPTGIRRRHKAEVRLHPERGGQGGNRSEPEVLSASLGPGEPGTVRRALEQRLTEAVELMQPLPGAMSRWRADRRADSGLRSAPRPAGASARLPRFETAGCRRRHADQPRERAGRQRHFVLRRACGPAEASPRGGRRRCGAPGGCIPPMGKREQAARPGPTAVAGRHSDGLASVCAVGPKVETRGDSIGHGAARRPIYVYVQDKAGVYSLDPSLSAHSQLPSLLSSGRARAPAGG